MATITRALLRQRLSESWGDYQAQTTTSAGAAAGASLIDTGLAALSADNGFFENWYVLITELVVNGPPVGEVRRVLSYTASTNTIVPVNAFSLQVQTGTDYELHRINPTLKHNALLRASELCFPGGSRHGLYLPLRNETLVVDNLMTNSDFETFSSTFTGWTNIGTPTLAQSTRTVHGTYSASIAATGAVEGIEQNILTSLNQIDAISKTLHVRGWDWDDAASSSRIRVTFDGSTYSNGAYNTGDGEWKGPSYNAIDVAIPADLTEATISCEVASGETGLFKWVVAWVDPIHKYTLPTTMLRGPFQVLQQVYDDKPEGPYAPITNYGRPTAGRILRLTGMGLLSQPTTDAGTVEIDTNQAEYFLAQASQWLYRAIRQGGSQQERDYIAQLRSEWQQDIAAMERNGTTMPNMAAELPTGTWHMEEDSTGKFLVFSQSRF